MIIDCFKLLHGKFPTLNGQQVALIRAEINTGIVLNEQFIRHRQPEKTPFTIFETLEDALLYVQEAQREREGVEFAIYDKDEKALQYIT